MQKSRTRNSQRRRAARSTPPARRGRLSVAFIVVSSVVICSMLAAGLVAVASIGLFGEDEDDAPVNYTDPNEDVVAAQQTKVAENPDDVDALLLLANLLGNTGRLDEAIPLYERATQMRPDDASIRLDFARALADGQKPADAEVQFQKALDLDPANQPANYYLAELYFAWTPQRAAEAIPLYEQVIRIDGATFLAEEARNRLVILGAASPAASPAATPREEGTPKA